MALDRLYRGIHELAQKRNDVQRRERYVRGDQDLPYAPQGVNEEYQDLREQAIANYIGLGVSAPTQRLRTDAIRTSFGEDVDKALWRDVWQANRLDTRQQLPYQQMMVHGRGIMSVWPNLANRAQPIVRPEDYELVHVEMDPDDPFTALWAVKVYEVEDISAAGRALILPGSTRTTRTVGVVFDATSVARFERGGLLATGDWTEVLNEAHPMRRVPFALYDYKPDNKGKPWSAIDVLIPQQDAINTIRFNTLLAMQFSAFRQRIVTGFDPRATDKDGNFLYKKNEDGTPVVDANGNAVPILNTPGRVGVDRLLAFPGGETKVFDLPESNLKNYIEVLESFLVQFFSTGQIPPQYLLSQMANLSGDALAGAESTLASLVEELKLAAGEGNETVYELAWYAAGNTEPWDSGAENVWADAEARSFSQIVDAVTKLVSSGFPQRAAFEMIPGATKQKVDRWMEMVEDEALLNRLAIAGRSFTDITVPPVNDQTEITSGAPANGG